MKKKQLIGIIVTGLVIIAVGVTGVLGNVIQAKFAETEETMGFWETIMSTEMSGEIILPEEDFIGLINVEGEIGPSSESLWSHTKNAYNHDLYMDYVDSLIEADNNKGIMLFIDSPGGTVYESDEFYLKLMEYKKVTGRPIYAYFGSQACSGGYYIAMAADYIVANRNCWTGSIGVIVSLVNCKDLYDKLGIEEIDITSGANKAMGSAALDLTEEQYAILQSLVDEAYDQFVEIVCDGRKMDDATVRSLADGRLYSANQAAEHKLVDVVGTMDDAKKALEKKAGVADDITYHAPENGASGMFSALYGMVNQLKPKSDTELATDIIENKGNGVLKYYAK